MTIGTVAAVVLALLGLITAIAFGVQGRRHLAGVRKTPALPAPGTVNAGDPADDVPTMRFKGEPFEEGFQGSRGYERPDDSWARASRDWGGLLWVSIITPLRPSRFGDPSYWTRYVPGFLALRAFIFILLPLLIVLLGQPENGPAGAFSPSSAQRAVPVHSTAYVADPAACGNSTPNASSADRPVFVNDVDDGAVFSVRPGSLVVISYYYGKPVFSPDVPLCVPTVSTIGDRSGSVEYQATGSGTGYIYIPQPTGTIVAEIQVPQDDSWVVFIFLGLTAAVVCWDITILIRLRRATRARFTRVG